MQDKRSEDFEHLGKDALLLRFKIILKNYIYRGIWLWRYIICGEYHDRQSTTDFYCIFWFRLCWSLGPFVHLLVSFDVFPNCSTRLTCSGKNLYYSDRSSTNLPLNSHWFLQYGTGDASGLLVQDTIRIGSTSANQLVIPKTYFGAATRLADFFWNVPMDGIFGLSVNTAIYPTAPLVNAYNQGKKSKKFNK